VFFIKETTLIWHKFAGNLALPGKAF